MADNAGKGAPHRFVRATRTVFEVEITPDEALLILNDHNKSNRPVKEEQVRRFARDMLLGRWVVTNQGIGFSTKGDLLDGQHRLWAAVEAKVSFRTIVVCGLDETARKNVDAGAPRKLGDQLAMFSELPGKRKPARWINSMVNLVAKRSPVLSTSDAEKLVEEVYKDGIYWLLRESKLYGKMASTQIEAALIFAYRTNPEKVHDFMLKLASGVGLNDGDPPLSLRRAALESVAWRNSSPRERVLRALHAIKHHISGSTIEKLYADENTLTYFTKAYGGLRLTP